VKNKATDYRLQTTDYRRRRTGFTLIEIIIYMALLGIFLLTLTDIFTSILDVQLESDATSAVEQDGRYILSRIAYDIPRSSDINIPPQIGQTRSNLRMTIGPETYEYSENGGNLQLINDLGTNNLNGSETTISNPSFQRIANSAVSGTKDTIKIQFTITSKTTRTGGPETKIFQTTIGRR